MRYDKHSSRLFHLTIASLLEERDLITQLSCLFCLIILQNEIYYVHSLQKFPASLLKISSNLTSGDLTGYRLGSYVRLSMAVLDAGFQMPCQWKIGFWITCQWNLDSEFQSLAGFWIP